MDEALLCDRVALVYKGEILACDAPAALCASYGETLYLAQTESPHRAYEALAASALCGQCSLFGEGVHLTLAPGVGAGGIERALEERGVEPKALRAIEPGLEDLFLKLMKE